MKWSVMTAARDQSGCPWFDWGRWRAAAEAELRALGCSDSEIRAEMPLKRGRIAARVAWVEERMRALVAAEEAAAAAWAKLVGATELLILDGPDGPALPPPPEQAAFDTILAELQAAAFEDRWPRHLHFGV
jgi:hypothetical protein